MALEASQRLARTDAFRRYIPQIRIGRPSRTPGKDAESKRHSNEAVRAGVGEAMSAFLRLCLSPDLGAEAGCGSACFLIRDARLPDVTLKTVDTVRGILRSDTCSPKYA